MTFWVRWTNKLVTKTNLSIISKNKRCSEMDNYYKSSDCVLKKTLYIYSLVKTEIRLIAWYQKCLLLVLWIIWLLSLLLSTKTKIRVIISFLFKTWWKLLFCIMMSLTCLLFLSASPDIVCNCLLRLMDTNDLGFTKLFMLLVL